MGENIGVIGSSGMIGRVVSEILSDKYHVIGGQRHKANVINNDNFTYCFLDINDENSVREFCNDCDVVVNCAGPSYVIKDSIARHCKKYVDLSGDMFFDDGYKHLTQNADSVFVVGAGYTSGLSAIIPDYYARLFFTKVDSIKCYQGSREKCSKNSLTDIILSSFSSAGSAGCYLKDGKLWQESIDGEVKSRVTGFPEEVYLKAYLSNEVRSMAERNNISEIHWYSAIPDKEIFDIASDFFKLCNISDISADSSVISKYYEIYNAVADSRHTWNALAYEMLGSQGYKRISKRIVCNVKSGYKVCGIIASMAAEAVIENDLKGLHWGFEVVDGKDAIEKLIEYDAIDGISCVDIFDEDNEEIEEEI